MLTSKWKMNKKRGKQLEIVDKRSKQPIGGRYFYNLKRSLLSLCSKTKINTLLTYEVLDKATIITGVVPLLPVSKRG